MAVQKATPIPRIFVSSTRDDMEPYRDAIRSAIDRAGCKAVGMERFGARSVSSLETCLEELKICQIYICAIGMRYGSIENESQKSYTQLEFEEAQKRGMPILAFLVNERKVRFLPSEMDLDEKAAKLSMFKDQIKNSSLTCDYFDSPSDLETKVLQSITKELNRQNEKHSKPNGDNPPYVDGAKIFSRFIHTPALYKNREAVLKVRFDGPFGTYMLNDELPKAFGFQPGTALFLNELFVLGKEPDVPAKYWSIDCFAESKAAEWIEDNEIAPGTIFTGRFMFAYEQVREIGRRTINGPAIDAYMACIILVEGIEIVSRNVPIAPKNDEDESDDPILKFFRKS